MSLRRLVRQEIISRQQYIMGKVLSVRERRDFDAGTSPVWVADIDVGGERVMRNVLIKTNNGTVRYAELGQTVMVDLGAKGRATVMGPGDRVVGTTEVKDYVIETGVDAGSGVDFGFSHARRPYDFYQGPTPGTPGTSLWSDGVNGYPKIAILDPLGNEV